jgi:hypothetical protein
MALGQSAAWEPSLTGQQTYTMHRASSADPTGANADRRKVNPGETLTLLDADGPGLISHRQRGTLPSETHRATHLLGR